jgi:hypothetical protein
MHIVFVFSNALLFGLGIHLVFVRSEDTSSVVMGSIISFLTFLTWIAFRWGFTGKGFLIEAVAALVIVVLTLLFVSRNAWDYVAYPTYLLYFVSTGFAICYLKSHLGQLPSKKSAK